MKGFSQRHGRKILGVLSGFDPMRFRGSFTPLTTAGGPWAWLWKAGVLLKDFKALADPTRRDLLDRLKSGPLTTGDLCRPHKKKLSRFAIMKHLGILENAGLLLVRRRGRKRWNHLNAVPIRRIYERWVSGYTSHWAATLTGLKRAVERSQQGERDMSTAATAAAEMRHFTAELEVFIDAPPARVFDALIRDVGRWWGFRQDTKRESTVTIEPRLGGLFSEQWGDGQGIVLGRVMQIDRPKKLRIDGPLGMAGRALVSTFTYALDHKDGGTQLKLSHYAMGDLDSSWQQSYRQGWSELLGTFLQQYVEKGRSAARQPPPCDR